MLENIFKLGKKKQDEVIGQFEVIDKCIDQAKTMKEKKKMIIKFMTQENMEGFFIDENKQPVTKKGLEKIDGKVLVEDYKEMLPEIIQWIRNGGK